VRAHRDTVGRIVHGYEAHGRDVLYDEEIPGRPPILDDEERQQVAEWLESTPRDVGYQQSNWTMKLLRYHIRRTFGKRISEEQVRVLARKLGFSLVRPTQLSCEADEAAKEQARQDLEGLAEWARWGWIRLLYEDEAILKRFPTLTRVWTRSGEQKVIPTVDDKERFAVYGAFDPIGGRSHHRFHPTIEQAGFRPFVEELERRYAGEDQPLVLVLDNASAHGYKGRHGWVKVRDGLYFYFLPPYCPDLNLAERPWKELRKRVTHNFLFESAAELKEAARRFMMYLQVMKSRVISLMGIAEPVKC